MIQRTEGIEIVVVTNVPARSPPVAPPVWSDHMKPRQGEGKHYFSPAVGKLGKSVKKQDTRPALRLEARLQHMHSETVDVFDEA